MNQPTRFLCSVLAVVGVVTATHAGGPIAISVGYDTRTMTRQECARKAVEAMGVKEKFCFAEITGDGNAQGWNATTAVRVLSFPTPDPGRIFIVVIAAGHNAMETERLQPAVRTHVFDGFDDPKTPERIPAAGEPPPRPITLSYRFAEWATNPVLRHLTPLAEVILEKKGYQTRSGGAFVMGFLPDRSLVAFPAPTRSAVLIRLNVVTATPGEEAGEPTAKDVLRRIGKTLYE